MLMWSWTKMSNHKFVTWHVFCHLNFVFLCHEQVCLASLSWCRQCWVAAHMQQVLLLRHANMLNQVWAIKPSQWVNLIHIGPTILTQRAWMMAQTLTQTFAYCGKIQICESQHSLLASHDGNMLCYNALSWRERQRFKTRGNEGAVRRQRATACLMWTEWRALDFVYAHDN